MSRPKKEKFLSWSGNFILNSLIKTKKKEKILWAGPVLKKIKKLWRIGPEQIGNKHEIFTNWSDFEKIFLIFWLFWKYFEKSKNFSVCKSIIKKLNFWKSRFSQKPIRGGGPLIQNFGT